jgi:hypothetical protein
LTLDSTIPSGSTVLVDYVAPAKQDLLRLNPALQDTSGNDADALSARTVTNTSVQVPDTIGPKPTSLVYSGNTVTITFNETLGLTTADASRFTAYIGMDPISVQSVAVLAPNKVVLTLTDSVPANSQVSVTYTPPTSNSQTSNSAVQDGLGNDALTFTAEDKFRDSPWAWVGGVTPTVAGECVEGTFPNSARERTLPNGITYSIGVSGSKSCVGSSNEPLSGRNGIDQQFASIGSASEPGTFLHTRMGTAAECGVKVSGTVQSCIRPDNFVIIKFSEPVVNPVIS